MVDWWTPRWQRCLRSPHWPALFQTAVYHSCPSPFPPLSSPAGQYIIPVPHHFLHCPLLLVSQHTTTTMGSSVYSEGRTEFTVNRSYWNNPGTCWHALQYVISCKCKGKAQCTSCWLTAFLSEMFSWWNLPVDLFRLGWTNVSASVMVRPLLTTWSTTMDRTSLDTTVPCRLPPSLWCPPLWGLLREGFMFWVCTKSCEM